MIKKIRYKFISITLISLSILLSFLMIAINWVNFTQVTTNADKIINFLENKESFETDKPSFNQQDGMPVETPFETRFFVAKFDTTLSDDKKYEPIEVNTSFVKAVSKEEAKIYASKVYKGKQDSGYEKNYRYRKYVSKTNANEIWITFVDCSRQLELIDNFFKISIIVISIGLILAFIAIFFISKLVVKPIEESDARQKKFITDAGHELKTPLTIISANNELIEMINGENEMTHTIDKEVKKMSSMVKNMTELSKLSEGTLLSKKEAIYFSLSNILYSACTDFSTSFVNKNISFKFSITPNVYIRGNENKITELISIILDNALKYSKSLCQISLLVNKNELIILQQNDGNDIKVGNMNQIFSRFYRSEEARASQIEGSGIGLSIAKEIVTIHRGKIEAFGDKNNLFNIQISFPIYKRKKIKNVV